MARTASPLEATCRPMYGQVTAESTDATSGLRFRLVITVSQVDDAVERRKLALALLRKTAERL